MALSPRHFEFAAELEAVHGKDVAGPVVLPRGKHAPKVVPIRKGEG